jgi:hypothetical protein
MSIINCSLGGDGGQIRATSTDHDEDQSIGVIAPAPTAIKDYPASPPKSAASIPERPPKPVVNIAPAAMTHTYQTGDVNEDEGDMYDLGGAGGKVVAASDVDDFQTVVDALKSQPSDLNDDGDEEPDLYDLGGKGGQIAAAQADNPTDFGTDMADEIIDDPDMVCMIPSHVASETTSLLGLGYVDAYDQKQPEPDQAGVNGYLNIGAEEEESYGFGSD